jgi:hypothetical protein
LAVQALRGNDTRRNGVHEKTGSVPLAVPFPGAIRWVVNEFSRPRWFRLDFRAKKIDIPGGSLMIAGANILLIGCGFARREREDLDRCRHRYTITLGGFMIRRREFFSAAMSWSNLTVLVGFVGLVGGCGDSSENLQPTADQEARRKEAFEKNKEVMLKQKGFQKKR